MLLAAAVPGARGSSRLPPRLSPPRRPGARGGVVVNFCNASPLIEFNAG
jgi:hypothetical protein